MRSGPVDYNWRLLECMWRFEIDFQYLVWGLRDERLTWKPDRRSCRIQFVRHLGRHYFLVVSFRPSARVQQFFRTFWRRSLYRWVEWEPGAHIHNQVELVDFVLMPSCRFQNSLGLNSKRDNCTMYKGNQTRQMLLNVLRTSSGMTALPVQNGPILPTGPAGKMDPGCPGAEYP